MADLEIGKILRRNVRPRNRRATQAAFAAGKIPRKPSGAQVARGNAFLAPNPKPVDDPAESDLFDE